MLLDKLASFLLFGLLNLKTEPIYIILHIRSSQGFFTSGTVRDHSNGEVDLSWVHVWRGADGVVTRLQQRKLGKQQSRRHLDGREFL